MSTPNTPPGFIELMGRETMRNERRDRSVRGRIARVTWPLFNFAEHFPCNVFGHRNVEIPPSQLTARERASGRMHFKCDRPGCGMRAGFSN